jgi:transposase
MVGQHHFKPEMVLVDMESMIPQNHLLRRIDRLINFKFVHDLCAPLYCADNGRPSIDPEVFFRICLVTYLYDIASDRKVCEELNYNLAFRWFCKLPLNERVPEHSSLTRIRDRLGEVTFKEIFNRLIELCLKNGIIKATKVMMDGSLIKADAALRSMVDRPKEGENLEDKKPPKSIKGRKLSNQHQVSKTDPDATLAGKENEPKKLTYKVHDTIDRDTRMVLDPHVTTGADMEGKVMLSRLTEIEANFDIKIRECTADRGYGYGANLHELENRHIKQFVPNFHGYVGCAWDNPIFKYHPRTDTITCPMHFTMTRTSNDESEAKDSTRHYKLKTAACFTCPLNGICWENPSIVRPLSRKAITRSMFLAIQLKTKKREADPEFRKLKSERQWKMEGVLAEAKDQHGLSRARYRGRAKMQIQAYLVSYVQNIMRLLKLVPARMARSRITQRLAWLFKSYFRDFCRTTELSKM